MNASEAIERTRAVLRRQHKALSTEQTYLHWLGRHIATLPRMAASLTSTQKVERFLTDLARYRDVSASTQNQALLQTVSDEVGYPTHLIARMPLMWCQPLDLHVGSSRPEIGGAATDVGITSGRLNL